MANTRTIRPRLASAYFGLESTFGTTPTMTRVFPIEGSVELGLEQEPLANEELRHYLYDALAPVHGLKGGTLKFSCYLRPDATQLGASAAYTQPWLGLPLQACFGAQYPTAGTFAAPLISSASDAATATMDTGSLTTKSAIILYRVAGALEPVRVINVASNTVTNWPNASATPTAGQTYDCWQWYLSSSAPSSFSFQYALADAVTHEWTLNGCVMTGLELSLEVGKLARATFTAKVGTWTGPQNQSIGSSHATNAMAAPHPIRANQMVLQAASLGTYPATFFGCQSLSVDFDLGTDHAPDLVGTEGKQGVVRTGGRPAATFKARVYPDVDAGNVTLDGVWHVDHTPLQAMFRSYTGSAFTRRWLVLDVPTFVLTTKPKPVLDVGKTMAWDLEGQCHLNTVVTAGTTDQALSPVVLALG